MSAGRYSKRGWAFQGHAFRPWALAGGSGTDAGPVAGWIAHTADRLSVVNVAERIALTSTQGRLSVAANVNVCAIANDADRVWIARSGNE